MIILPCPHVILPPEKPALTRKHDLRGLSSWEELDKHLGGAGIASAMTFPFPSFGYSAAAYTTTAVNFDGTNDALNRAAELTGLADGKKGIVSFWVRFNGGDGSAQIIFEAGGSQLIGLQRTSGNKFSLGGYNAAVSNILALNSTTTYTAGSTWRHILASWDLGITAGHLYVNDVNDLDIGTDVLTNDTIDYTNGDHFIGQRDGGTRRLNADLADLYVNFAEYLDISVEANRRKFVSSTGKPVNLGVNGSTPTGTQPIIFLKGTVAGGFANNKGSGGGFTTIGTLTDASGSPSD